MDDGKIVLAEDEVARALVRIAHEIAERNATASEVALVGIHRRGAVLATRLRALLCELLDAEQSRWAIWILVSTATMSLRDRKRPLCTRRTSISTSPTARS